jgi:hypothetical protein
VLELFLATSSVLEGTCVAGLAVERLGADITSKQGCGRRILLERPASSDGWSACPARRPWPAAAAPHPDA